MHTHGFTLLEVLLTVAITALMVMLVGTSAGSLEKQQLISTKMQITTLLQSARQDSIGAKYGQEYSITLNADSYSVQPTNRTQRLPYGIAISADILPKIITFEKTSGKSISTSFMIESKNYSIQINVTDFGSVNSGIPEKKI